MKIFFTCLICLIINPAVAQNSGIGFRVGLNASYQRLSNPEVGSIRSGSSGEEDASSHMLPGVKIGLISVFKIGKLVMLRPSILFTAKGQREEIDESFDDGGLIYDDRINYLEIPLTISVDLGKTPDKGIFLSGGVYAAYGISGKTKYTRKSDNYQQKGDAEFVSEIKTRTEYNSSNLLVKPWDYGIKTGVGYRTGKLIFEITYELGLMNINPQILTPRSSTMSNDHEWNDRAKQNRVLSVNIEYLLFTF